MYKYIIEIGIGYTGANREDEVTNFDLGYEDDEWEKLSEDDKDEILREYADELACNYVEISIYPINDEE